MTFPAPIFAACKCGIYLSKIVRIPRRSYRKRQIFINHCQHPEYRKISWTIQVPDERVMTIHTLVVNPDYRGCGFGEKLVRFGINFSKAFGAETIRLDTHYKNIPARRLCEKCGFKSLGCHKASVDGVTQEFDVFEYDFPLT